MRSLILFLFTLPFSLHCAARPIEDIHTGAPARFTENKGQVTDQNGKLRTDVKYIYAAPGFKLILKENSFSYEVYTVGKEENALALQPGTDLPFSLSRGIEKTKISTHRIDIKLTGANKQPRIVAGGKSSDYNGYYTANTPEEGIKEVYSYSGITYKNIWPGIDIEFKAEKEGRVEYDFIVHAGARIEDIQMQYAGMEALQLADGKLRLKTAAGDVEESIPASYLKENGQAVTVDYSRQGNTIRYNAAYDKNSTLVIDPVVAWATYYGGSSYEYAGGVATDKKGNVYLAGHTNSTAGIATSGAFQSSKGSNADFYIVKFNQYGKRLWGTYFGKFGSEDCRSLACDAAGNIYLTGHTSSTAMATTGAQQTSLGGCILAKFNTDGSRQWSTYYGGSSDWGSDVDIDAKGNVYLTGTTSGSATIYTTGAHQTSYGGAAYDAFLVKFSSDGVRQWGTYYGGSSYDHGDGVACDTLGNVYLGGYSSSTSGIATSGSFLSTSTGGGYLAKFDSSGVRKWGTYLGSVVYDMVCDKPGNVYPTGWTMSFTDIATAGAYQETLGRNADAFLLKFDSAGKRIWGTYYGGQGDDVGNRICMDDSSDIYFTGYTLSPAVMASPDAPDTSYAGNSKKDAYVAKFDTSGQRLWGTYYGSTGADDGIGIASFRAHTVHIAGNTNSTDLSMVKAHSPTHNGGTDDAFLVKYRYGTYDFSLDSVLNVPSVACMNDSFTLPLIISNKGTYIDTLAIYVGATLKSAGSSGAFTVNDSAIGIILPGVTDTVDLAYMIKVLRDNVEDAANATLTVYLYGDDNALNDTLRFTIYVNEQPVISINDTWGGTACHGKEYTLPFAITAAAGPTHISYAAIDYGDGTLDTLRNFKAEAYQGAIRYEVGDTLKHTYSSYGTFYPSVTAFAANGCVRTDSVAIVVNPTPVADFTFSNVCLDSSMLFKDASAVAAGSIIAYKWDFGDTAFRTVQNPSHLYAYPGTFKVKLIVTTDKGCRDSIEKIVTVNPPPVADFTFSDGCTGVGVPFTNTSSVSSGNLVLYRWDFGDGYTSDTAYPVRIYSQEGIYTVKLSAYTEYGCKNVIQKRIQIHTSPQADFSFSTPACEGDPVAFQGLSSIATGTIVSRQWDFGDSSTSADQSPAHTYLAAGSYTVKLVVTGDRGCADSMTKTISIVERSIPDFSYSSHCADTAVQFTNMTTKGTVAAWHFGDGSTSTEANPSHLYAEGGGYAVTLVTADANGCRDSITKTVSVHTLPKPGFSFSEGCLGETSIFVNESISPDSIASYFWDFGDGSTDTDKSPLHTYASSGTYTVKLVAVSAYGCRDSISKQLVVYPLPIADFEGVNLCNRNMQFDDRSIMLSGSVSSYQWSFGDGGISSLQAPVHQYNNSGTYPVRLIVTSDKGCKDTMTKTIEVYPQPKASFTYIGTCLGDTALFLDSSMISGDKITSWLWDFGDGSTDTLQQPMHLYSSDGSYTVSLTVTSSKGCSSKAEKTVDVLARPSALFSIDSIATGRFRFTANDTAAAYLWSFGDGQFSMDSYQVEHAYTQVGAYPVVLVLSHAQGCADSSSQLLQVPVANSLQENAMTKSNWKIYPNPVNSGSITLVHGKDICNGERCRLTLTDMLGKVILSHEMITADKNTLELPAQITQGAYMLSIQHSGGLTVEKIMVE